MGRGIPRPEQHPGERPIPVAAYDAILFDFDGVLADTEPFHFKSWRDLLEPLGFPVTWEFYLTNCVGVQDENLFPRVFPIRDASQVRELVAQKRSTFRALLEASSPIPKETGLLISELSPNFPLAVVSSSARSEVEPPIVRAGIRDHFRLLLTYEDVEQTKPSPIPYLKAARLLDAKNPLVIEDSASGIASAKAAGFDLVEIQRLDEVARKVRDAITI